MPAERLGPLISRRRLGVELVALRNSHRETLEDVRRATLISTSTVSRLENGGTPPRQRDMIALLVHYGELDTEVGRRLLAWAADGRRRGWWQDFGDVLPRGAGRLISYEAEASTIAAYVSYTVPGLLQTADYAGALLAALEPQLTPQAIDRLVEVRLRRQTALRRPERPLRLEIVLAETALHRVVGSPGVMLAQLRALAELDRPNVALQVFPFAAGPHVAMQQDFQIFLFADPLLPDVVGFEDADGMTFTDKTEQVHTYRDILRDLRAKSPGSEDSRDLIRAILSRHN